MTNSFLDNNPRGFGLVQRDRNFRNYADDGVFYDRRPTLWVEPKGAWGEGQVQLVEIPTEDEILRGGLGRRGLVDRKRRGCVFAL